MLSFSNLTHWYEWCLLAFTIMQYNSVYIVSRRNDLEVSVFNVIVPGALLALLLYCMTP